MIASIQLVKVCKKFLVMPKSTQTPTAKAIDPVHNQTRDLSINIRISQNQRDLIDRAATLQGKSRSEFMLESAHQKAQDVLLDRCLFDVSAERFQQFVARLDAPVMSNQNLRQLLTAKAPWD